MAVGSQKRKKSKRPSSERSAPMASSPTHRKTLSSTLSPHFKNICRGITSLPSVLLTLCVVLLVYITWKTVSNISRSPRPHFYSIEVVNEYPHDPAAFTQGLLYAGNDILFESTGLYKKSSVRKVLLQTGKVEAFHQMDGSFFGEGLTLLGGRLFQVTWLERTGFIYDRYNLSKRQRFTHQMKDGWGLATDGNVIFGTDGTSSLYQLDPQNLKVIRRATVTYKDREVPFLNELEYVNGEVWANVWQTDCIARISHKDGKVLGWILLHKLRKGLLTAGHSGVDVLNGIAWDEEKNRVFVTGKLWPKLYEIKLHPVKGTLHGTIEELCRLR